MAKFLEYVPGESFLHRMNPCVKLIGAVLIAIACFVTSNPNIGYKMDVREFSGNYAAAATEAGQLAVLNVHGKAIDTNTFPNAWTDTSKTVAELFEDAANGNFKLKMDAQAGDPRWYKNAR